MSRSIESLITALKAAAEEEITLRESGDTSDRWQDDATPENVLKLVDALSAKQAEPVYWEIAGHLFTTKEEALKPGYRGTPEPLYEEPPVNPANSPEIPEGWKLVPIEPNWEMLSADGCKEHHKDESCLHHDNRKRIWSAMLASTPEKENG